MDVHKTGPRRLDSLLSRQANSAVSLHVPDRLHLRAVRHRPPGKRRKLPVRRLPVRTRVVAEYLQPSRKRLLYASTGPSGLHQCPPRTAPATDPPAATLTIVSAPARPPSAASGATSYALH